jgi:hypothetical protein
MISLSLSRRKPGRFLKTRSDGRRAALARGKHRKYASPSDGRYLATRKYCKRDLDSTSTHASHGYLAAPDNTVQSIVSVVNGFPPDELLGRYHELVDKRLAGTIDFLEGFELERIEARLDAEDRGGDPRAETLHKEWEQRQEAVLSSIEHLIGRLRASK